MPTFDYLFPNQTFPAMRSDMQEHADATQTTNSNATAPADTAGGMLWADTTDNILWQRNEADSAWIPQLPWQNKIQAAKTGTYAVVQADFDTIIPVDSTSASFTVSLPAVSAVSVGFRVTLIKTVSTNIVTVDPNSSETINGATTIAMGAQYEALTIVNTGTAWLASRNRGNLLNAPNIISNGTFVDFRPGSNVAGTGGGFFAATRFRGRRNGGVTGITMSRQSGESGVGRYALRVRRDDGNTNTANTNLCWVSTQHECLALRGRVVTLYFRALRGSGFSATSNLLSLVVQTTDTATEQTAIGSSGAFSAGSTTNVVSTSVTLGTSYDAYSVTFVVPTSAYQFLINWNWTPPSAAAASNDYIDISLVTMVPGALPLLVDTMGKEVHMRQCSAFFRSTFPEGTDPAQNAGTTGMAAFRASDIGAGGINIRFDEPMFTAGTLTTYNPSAANANWRNTNDSTDTVPVASFSGNSGIFLQSTTTAGDAGNVLGIHYTVNSGII